MRRRIRTTGLALLAVFALGAVAAQGAWASSFDYGPAATILGSGGEQVITVGTSQLKCSGVTFETSEFNATEIKTTPNYPTGQCTFVGFPAHVILTGRFVFTSNRTMHLTANMHITPTFLGSSVCTMTILAGTYGITGYDNSGTSPNTVTITSNITGLVYEETMTGCGIGSGTTGTYSGEMKAEGSDSENHRTEIRWTA